jgi:hypothetical protein
VIKIAGAPGISEAQLRAQGVLKPQFALPPASQSAQQLAAGRRAIECFLAR